LQIVEVVPVDETPVHIILSQIVENEVLDFINLIKHASDLEMAGVDLKKTLLLYGVPGCGKTSIAHYISEKTGLPLVIARLDGIVSSLLGSTAKNIRKIFDYTNSMPCILFLDEFDAIAKARDDSRELGELKRVINSLLQNIDNMPNSNVMIAATNHPELLDNAVWRRFTQKIEVKLPETEEIEPMIGLFTKNFDTDFLHDSSKMNKLINALLGLSPSDIKNIFDRAKVKCILSNEKTLKYDRILLSTYDLRIQNKTEKNLIDYLYSNGVTQINVNHITGISLRKIKLYLSKK
jgi:SpoVK/Ycf46/Vps4 family AAA+-type ATPase